MLKRNITYEDYNGETITETFYFNLSKSELVELELNSGGGSFNDSMTRIVNAKDNKALLSEFKKIILMSYGVKSDDGKRFIKTDELREQFTQTAAYNSLFMELVTSDKAAIIFIEGVIPKDMVEVARKGMDEQTPAALSGLPNPSSLPPAPPQALPDVDPYGPSEVKKL